MCSANYPRKQKASLGHFESHFLYWNVSGQLSYPSTSEQSFPATGMGREGEKTLLGSLWSCHSHCCWEVILFWGHKNKDEERASQGGAGKEMGIKGMVESKPRQRKLGKIKMGKESGNAHSNSTAKHWPIASSPIGWMQRQASSGSTQGNPWKIGLNWRIHLYFECHPWELQSPTQTPWRMLSWGPQGQQVSWHIRHWSDIQRRGSQFTPGTQNHHHSGKSHPLNLPPSSLFSQCF